MHEVIVHFERVFDVVQVEAGDGNQRHTLFGFQNSEMRQCGLKVPGWPEVTANTSYAIVLMKADDWQSIMGWVNLDTGEVAKNHAFATVVIAAASLFASLLLSLGGGNAWPIALGLVVVAGVAAFQLRNELAANLVLMRRGKAHRA